MWKLLAVLTLIIGTALWYPSPIQSVAFQPSRPLAMSGTLAPNDALQITELTHLPGLRGGEDVALDRLKCLYTGVESGEILRKCPYSDWETLVNTGGRPLGLAFDHQQNLIIADGIKGLLKLSPTRELTTLADHFRGKPLRVVDDVDIAADGTIYFTDASQNFALKDYVLDALAAKPSGRLFSYSPASGKLMLLADELYFANGVAVAANQHFVLVNESFAYRTTRIWLKGDKAGRKDLFVNKLPGIPDGIAADKNGTFWMALYAPRSQLIDAIHPIPFIKNQLAKLPKNLAPLPAPYGFIVQLDSEGKIIQSLHDPAAVAIGGITSVQPEVDGLYLGTLHGNTIGKLAF